MSADGSKFRNSDLPAVEDRLGTEKQRGGLVRFMRECSTPMTIAVQGDWGTGKTSMMQLLQKQLEGENGCTLWFPTWQFAVLGEQDRLLMDLVIMLCHRLEEKYSKVFDKKSDEIKAEIKEKKERILHAVGMTTLSLLAETAKAVTGVDFSNVLGTAIGDLKNSDTKKKADYISYPILISGLDDDLKSLIDLYLGENKAKRLYIFIDDLDRLEPVRAVELLEGIKNFLDIPRCVFMIAIDTKVVMEGLRKKYGDNMDTKKQEHFFDKIIQIPYKLPVHNYDLISYMQDVLEGYDEENVHKYVSFLKEAGIRNPRTIKRCINFCLLHKCIDGKGAVSEDKSMCLHRFAVKSLELEHEDLYWMLLVKAIEADEEQLFMKNWLHEYCTHPETDEAKKKMLTAVMKCFGVDDPLDLKLNNVRMFCTYIQKSAPSDITWYRYVSNLQMYLALINKLSFKIPEPIPELAKKLEHNSAVKTEIPLFNMKIEVFCYNSILIGTSSPLKLCLSECQLDEKSLFQNVRACPLINYVIYPHNHQDDDLFYEKEGTQYTILNILDTSSPDAPIYQVLRNAGIIT